MRVPALRVKAWIPGRRAASVLRYHPGMANIRWHVVALLLLATAALPSSLQLPVQQPDELRVVSYNIKHGRGNDTVVDLERTAAVIRAQRPDVVGLQEVDDRAERSGTVPQAQRLGELLGMHHAFGRFMPFQGGAYGMAILTRQPIVSTTSVQLPEGNEPRIALAVQIRLADGRPGLRHAFGGQALTIVNVHFDWVNNDAFRFAQADALTKYLDGLKAPYIVLGDFNDLPESRTLALFKSRTGEARKPDTDRFTFPATAPAREIDFIFFAPPSGWRAREVQVIDERVASDHRPVLAVLERTR